MKKNTDWDRISKEKHEIAYCRKLAKAIIHDFEPDNITTKSCVRVAKAFLKITKGYMRKK